MKSIFCLIIFAVIGLVNCNGGSSTFNNIGTSNDKMIIPEPIASTESSGAMPAPPPSAGGGEDAIAHEEITPKIIKSGEVRIQVENLKKSRLALNPILQKYEAYISNENETGASYQNETSITIRTNKNYDSLLIDIIGLATYVEYKRINLQDVTEEYIDVTARLKTKKEVEQRYKDILKQAKNIEDILKVETQLSQIREQIESAEGRIKFLNNKTQYSTLTLNMYEKLAYQASPDISFFSKLFVAFKEGWYGLLSLIIGIVSSWHIWLFLAFLFSIIRWLWLKRKRNKQATILNPPKNNEPIK